MLVIRKGQLQAFQAEKNQAVLLPIVLEGLRSAGCLPDEASSESGEGEESECERGAEDLRGPALEAFVLAEIESGQKARIETDDGLIQFVAYAFQFSPGWRDLPGIQEILDSQEVDESGRLSAVHKQLTNQ